MEFILGGVAACGAGFFTNPLEVVKTRMQLQGELQARGLYTVYYRNVFHAFYTIARNDGILALQNGLVPALWYQMVMNGIRLGSYQTFMNLGLTQTGDGTISAPRSVVAGAVAGCLGAGIGSPLYLIKTHLQAQAAAPIAVGYQHHHENMRTALAKVYKEAGIKGLWRGVSAAIPRVTVGSACQLTTFSKSKEIIGSFNILQDQTILSVLLASMLSGIGVSMMMTPFDVVSTRIYNQGVDTKGKGLLYSGVLDCFVKIFQQEGPLGFYKGWLASFLRIGPHTVLSLFFWDQLRLYFTDSEEGKTSFIYSSGSE